MMEGTQLKPQNQMHANPTPEDGAAPDTLAHPPATPEKINDQAESINALQTPARRERIAEVLMANHEANKPTDIACEFSQLRNKFFAIDATKGLELQIMSEVQLLLNRTFSQINQVANSTTSSLFGVKFKVGKDSREMLLQITNHAQLEHKKIRGNITAISQKEDIGEYNKLSKQTRDATVKLEQENDSLKEEIANLKEEVTILSAPSAAAAQALSQDESSTMIRTLTDEQAILKHKLDKANERIQKLMASNMSLGKM